MSLFKIREFWAIQSEDDEYFDQNSLIVTKLNGDSDLIVSGSQSGVLRIFEPSCDISDGNIRGFLATDLLVEMICDNPILQVGCGRFVSGSQMIQLAVLQPRLLSVYSLRIKDGATEYGSQSFLESLYEHNLKRSAANFTIGPFGGTQNRDFICVQSLDGMLSFFEQESATFSCSLPDFLFPAPLAYVKKIDSFVTSCSNWTVVSYKYNLLSEAGGKSEETSSSSRKVTCDWSYNLGEIVLDMLIIDDFQKKEACILILGERNLYCLAEKGNIKFMKRLEYSPIGFDAYVLDDKIFSMIISETSTLLIYQDTTLKWSAKLQFLPVCIKRAFLPSIKGALVLLSEEGRLECCYLGTEPSLFVAPPLAVKEIDFDTVEEELENLNKSMKHLYGNDIKLSNPNAEKDITLSISIDNNLEPLSHETKYKTAENLKMCTLTIEVNPKIAFDEVQITLAAMRPIKVTPQVKFLTNVTENTSFTCHAFLDDDCEIPSLNVDVVATAVTSLGIPRCINKWAMLPAKLVSDFCPAQKESEHKITLSINQSPVPLAILFPEYFEDNPASQTTNAVGFRTFSSKAKILSILLAKSSERYRIQSDSFASLSLIIEQLIFRLEKYYSNTNDFKLSYNSPLPSNELVLYVNKHFAKRQQATHLQNELCQLSAQFRIIQKRLIAKLKVKNPTPLTNLEILLKDTYAEINKVTEKLELANEELSKAQIELTCALHLVVQLIKISDLEKHLKEDLQSVFCCSVADLEDQNWEDVMDASLCYLLRTSLAKSDKDRLRIAQTSFEEVKDISKVEKHLAQVLERVSKKGKIIEDVEETADGNREDESEPVTFKTEEKPIGSQFGEASTRLLSARKSFAKTTKQ